MRLDALVRSRFQLSWGKARDYIESGKVWSGGVALTDPAAETDPSVELELRMNTPRSGGSGAKGSGPRAGAVLETSRSIVFSDTQLVVADKPAGLSSVPFDETEKDSFEQRLCRSLRVPRLIVVHRLDRETSGLLVFARTQGAGKSLANQFRFKTARRRYFALVHGEFRSQTFHSLLVEDRGDGLRGSIRASTRDGGGISRAEAKAAITHARALRSFAGMTLVECVLETGRTHQIRIHLSEAGHPLVGEKLYVREFRGPLIEAPRQMLHAAELGFMHPVREAPLRFTRLPPEDFLSRLGSERVAIERELASRLK